MRTFTIARFTLQEAISRRLILAGIALSVAFLALFALGFYLIYAEAARDAQRVDNRVILVGAAAILTVLGLYAVYFMSSFLALFLSVGAVSGEIDSGTLHAVLARPLARWEYVLGRWLGYAGMMVLYVGAMSALLLLIARLISGYEPSNAARAVGLMMLGSLLLLTVSLFGSTIMSTLANGVVVFSLFGLAWLAGIIEFIGGLIPNATMVNLGIVVSLLIPSDGVWRAASFYIQSPAFLLALGSSPGGMPFASSQPPATPFVLWATAYPLLFLALAVRAFRNRDL